MKIILRGLSSLSLALLTATCTTSPDSDPDIQALGPFLDSLMAAESVPGIGFATFDDRGVTFEYVGGLKRQDEDAPIDATTRFEAASISKPVFAYVVLSLVHDGLFDLETPLHELVEHVPEVGYDPRSRDLTPRILLTHQGGLPNWRSRLNLSATTHAELFEPGDTLRFTEDPGEGYNYSGEGFVLLQRVVEELTNRPLGDLAKEIVFDPLGMTNTSFSFDEASRVNHAWGHNRQGNPDKWQISATLSSSTLHTTAADLARFGAHLAAQVRTGGPFAELATPHVTVGSEDGAELAWGLGLGVLSAGPGRYLYHGGNNVIFIADFIYGTEENLGYALLTNSSNGGAVADAVERRVFGRDMNR